MAGLHGGPNALPHQDAIEDSLDRGRSHIDGILHSHVSCSSQMPLCSLAMAWEIVITCIIALT